MPRYGTRSGVTSWAKTRLDSKRCRGGSRRKDGCSIPFAPASRWALGPRLLPAEMDLDPLHAPRHQEPGAAAGPADGAFHYRKDAGRNDRPRWRDWLLPELLPRESTDGRLRQRHVPQRRRVFPGDGQAAAGTGRPAARLPHGRLRLELRAMERSDTQLGAHDDLRARGADRIRRGRSGISCEGSRRSHGRGGRIPAARTSCTSPTVPARRWTSGSSCCRTHAAGSTTSSGCSTGSRGPPDHTTRAWDRRWEYWRTSGEPTEPGPCRTSIPVPSISTWSLRAGRAGGTPCVRPASWRRTEVAGYECAQDSRRHANSMSRIIQISNMEAK